MEQNAMMSESIPDIAVEIPEMNGLQMTLTNIPAEFVHMHVMNMVQIKLYYRAGTTVSFSRGGIILVHGRDRDMELELQAGQILHPGDCISCGAKVMPDGGFIPLDKRNPFGGVMLAIVAEGYYAKNVAEGNTFAHLRDFERIE